MASLPYPRSQPNYLPTEPYAAKPSVSICEICGRLFSARSFCVFCEFCGRITMLVHECSVGAAETAAPPGRVAWVWQDAIPSYDKSVGVVATQRGHGGMPCPLTLVMWMRGYGKDAIPSYDYLTSTFLTLPSAVRTMFRPFWSLLSLTPLTVKNSTSPSATVVALIPVSGSLGAVQSLSTTLT